MKPPLQLYGLDGTYATALFVAATRNNSLDQADRSLNSLKQNISKDSKLNSIISNPSLSTADKSTVVSTLTRSAGGDKTLSNFLSVLADNNRLGLITDISNSFTALMRAHRGEVEATITSAQQLDNRTISRLETAIQKNPLIRQGQRLKVVNKVDAEILGGLVVEVNDRTIDLSVSSKISRLNKILTDTL